MKGWFGGGGSGNSKSWDNNSQDDQGGEASSTDQSNSGGVMGMKPLKFFRQGIVSGNSDSNRGQMSRDWTGRPSLQAGVDPRKKQMNAELERKISASSSSLGESIQRIVMAAKEGNDLSWKDQLLELFGGTDEIYAQREIRKRLLKSSEVEPAKSTLDADILLDSSSCEKFVEKTTENELAPNLIHCMRLFRVLELQRTAEFWSAMQYEQDGTFPILEVEEGAEENASALKPTSQKAVEKTTQLLLLLCKSSRLGEQLRPHLFGLLALSGAAYPKNGIHVGKAASIVICKLADNCLGDSLVWFLHARKMIVHMTDDVKELVGMVSGSRGDGSDSKTGSNNLCLFGEEAEKEGMWVCALSTIVSIVTNSCRFQTVELLNDFDAAGGYYVLSYAIVHSIRENMPKMLELAVKLSCCSTNPSPSPSPAQSADNNALLIKNVPAFVVLYDLASRSIPFLADYTERLEGKTPDFNSVRYIKAAAKDSVQTSVSRDLLSNTEAALPSFEISSELLLTTLQVYSSHPKNFALVETKFNILAMFLVSYPTFRDYSAKICILKTLEYICTTGLVDNTTATPLIVTCEIFFALCMTLLGPLEITSSVTVESLMKDTEVLCETLEKALKFDEYISKVLFDCGILDSKLNDFLGSVAKQGTNEENASCDNIVEFGKSASLEVEMAYMCMCRILRLTIAKNRALAGTVSNLGRLNLNILLTTAVKDLSEKASRAALLVFQEVMSVSLETLEDDIICLLDLVKFLVSAHKSDVRGDQPIIRQSDTLRVLGAVMDANEHAKPAFRKSGGFEVLIMVFQCLEESFLEESDEIYETAVLSLVETVFSVIGSAYNLNASETSSVGDLWFYSQLAGAISQTGLFNSTQNASRVLNLALTLMDTSLSLSSTAKDTSYLANADAAKLVLSLLTRLPLELSKLSDWVMEIMLNLCSLNSNSTLVGIMANSGLVKCLTSAPELSAVIANNDHPLHKRLCELLQRLASYSMTNSDFVSLLRCIGMPILREEKYGEQVVLPVIVSSLQQSSSNKIQHSKYREMRDLSFCEYLEIALRIVENEDKVARYKVGGGSIDKMLFYMQDTPAEDRMYVLAQEGKLSFVEIPSISDSVNNASPSSAPAVDKLWAPASTGFSFSLWLRLPAEDESIKSIKRSGGYRGDSGTLYLLDLHTPPTSTEGGFEHLSFWYDLASQKINVSTTYNATRQPDGFNVTPLSRGIWHHLVVSFIAPKRGITLGKKARLSLTVDGQLAGEIKIDQINIPASARCLIGCPNPKLLTAGKKYMKGPIPIWEVGQYVLLGKTLTPEDATAVYFLGPDFDGAIWGDNPQKLSFLSTATSAFPMIDAADGDFLEMTESLRQRKLLSLQNVGKHVDSLDKSGFYCTVMPNDIVFALNAKSAVRKRERGQGTLLNIGKISEMASTDALLYGDSIIIAPNSFSNNLRWVGGPPVLLPLLRSVQSSKAIALSLRLIRATCQQHIPNLQSMQGSGCYRIMGLLLQQKMSLLNEEVLESCFAFAVHNFSPSQVDNAKKRSVDNRWLIIDVSAVKYLLLNGQVWGFRKRPSLSFRLVSLLNELVSDECAHSVFNARNLHQCSIIRWVLHLMFEAGGLSDKASEPRREWKFEEPLISEVTAGDDPGNDFLRTCKQLLYRVLKHWLVREDLVAISDAITTTLTAGGRRRANTDGSIGDLKMKDEDTLSISGMIRIYLFRLLQELVVDGVLQFVARVRGEATSYERAEDFELVQANNPSLREKASGFISRKPSSLDADRPDARQNRISLPSFVEVLSPIWFASVLEYCPEEASASSALRLLILCLQGSPSFTEVFAETGGFMQFINSIPKFCTSPSIILSLVSHLVDTPITQLPYVLTLEDSNLREIFEKEPDENPIPPPDVFAILMECLIRNVQLSGLGNQFGPKAKTANSALIGLITHMYKRYQFFKIFCHSDDFLRPFMHLFFAISEEKEAREATPEEPESSPLPDSEGKPRSSSDDSLGEIDEKKKNEFMAWPSENLLSQNPKRIMTNPMRSSILNDGNNESPSEQFMGDIMHSGDSALLVRLLHVILSDAVFYKPLASNILHTLFKSIPAHSTPEKVEMFQLMLVERSRMVIDDALSRGGPTALANCCGYSSVLLDRLVGGYFRAESVMLTVKGALNTLRALTSTYANATLGQSDQNSLVSDMSFLARLVCIAGLQRMRPDSDVEENLIYTVVKVIAANAKLLLFNAVTNSGKSSFLLGSTSAYIPPPVGNSKHPIWQSASVVRSSKDCTYPDLMTIEEPDRAFVVSLMAELHYVLSAERQDIREAAVHIVIALLQQRKPLMSELLIQDITFTGPKGEQKKETVDLFQRGGFGALLLAHESASIAENVSTVASRRRNRRGSGIGGMSVGALKYASFFEWYRKNKEQVGAVFQSIHLESVRHLSSFHSTSTMNPFEVIQRFQNTVDDEAANNIVLSRGMELADVANAATERTFVGHDLWQRQGFGDLAYGAMKWKTLLRELKGSRSIWEKNVGLAGETANFGDLHEKMRWKLDLSECHERQRRKLLPNYEFEGLYNLVDERQVDRDDDDVEEFQDSISSAVDNGNGSVNNVSDLLKELQLKAGVSTRFFVEEEEEDLPFDESFYDADGDLGGTEDGNLSKESDDDASKAGEGKDTSEADKVDEASENQIEEEAHDFSSDSNYNVIIGLLEPEDYPRKSYNICRCTGLDVRRGLLLLCRESIYVIDGFQSTGGEGLDGTINRVEQTTSTFHVNIRKSGALSMDASKNPDRSMTNLQDGDTDRSSSYSHRCQRVVYDDLYGVYKRRYQLRDVALEIFDVHRSSSLLAFASVDERDDLLSHILRSPLPNSVFHSYGMGSQTNYKKIITAVQVKVTAKWAAGCMSNFDFLMHMNMFAGRSYNDLTQYPVFPWVLSDYDSDEIDLDDPSIYRDFSKPMGAQGEARAVQFQERFAELESIAEMSPEDNPPPFHYGTHYSCAAYVLYYLMRLEPYSRLALQLQGGRFDVADRLFQDIGSSWRSAAHENLQDVRELIPEFFCLPEFLVNSNSFDFGVTQSGAVVNDVKLPPWAKGDPKRFVRIQRMALESEYVTKHLHTWIDLIFGCKQRGSEAKEALNMFVHVTYEGQVDLDAIDDPVMREATITQVQNFGQTPSRIEKKPFPNAQVPCALKDKYIDFNALSVLAHSTPPFCVVGAPHRVYVEVKQWTTCRVGMSGQVDSAVGDIGHSRGNIVAVGRTCTLIRPAMTYFRYGGPNNGVSVHVGAVSVRLGSANSVISAHDDMHSAPICVAKASLNGRWLVTGCEDSTVRVWRAPSTFDHNARLQLKAVFCGHENGKITCIDVDTVSGIVVTGGSDGCVLMWDLRSCTFLRQLKHGYEERRSISLSATCVTSVSINKSNGNVLALVRNKLFMFDVNGFLIATYSQEDWNDRGSPTCAIATGCPEWMENGVAAITGHKNGDVRLWSVNYGRSAFLMRHLVQKKVHTCPITALAVCGDNNDILLMGDASGKVSEARTLKLESLAAKELAVIVKELEAEKQEKEERRKWKQITSEVEESTESSVDQDMKMI